MYKICENCKYFVRDDCQNKKSDYYLNSVKYNVCIKWKEKEEKKTT